MPTFKPKNSKHFLSTKNIDTLDKKHNQYIEEFNINNTKEIPKLQKKIKTLKNKYLSTKSIEKKLLIKDEIKNLKKKQHELKNKEQDYYLENSKLIFNYFEKKKEISAGTNKTTILNSFFNITNNNAQDDIDSSTVQKYMANIDENNMIDCAKYIKNIHICRKCNTGELIPVDDEGVMICNNCGIFTEFLVETDKPSYKEPPKEVSFYAYKKINHFREILAQFQAKETTLIPDEVIMNIKAQIKKERIETNSLTNIKTKDILKKLGYNKYYEHIPFIKDRLGIKPPLMTPELEETLCNLFSEIQAPYAKHCPDYRVNFLNYYYTIYKLCELLDQRQFLPYFPMLKDREKKMEQDNIWKKICKDMKWEFIPTI